MSTPTISTFSCQSPAAAPTAAAAGDATVKVEAAVPPAADVAAASGAATNGLEVVQNGQQSEVKQEPAETTPITADSNIPAAADDNTTSSGTPKVLPPSLSHLLFSGAGRMPERHELEAELQRQAADNDENKMQVDEQSKESAQDELARLQAAAAVTYLEQAGRLLVGPGAEKEAQLLGLGLPKLSSRPTDAMYRAKRYAMDLSVKHVLMKQTQAQQQNLQKIQMYAQALSLMARVYVGNLAQDVKEESLRTAFAPFGSIKGINMSRDPNTGLHKAFAFIEFEVPEAGVLAEEQMAGVQLVGRPLRVESRCAAQAATRQTSMPQLQAQPIVDSILEEGKSFNRIYVASVHPDLSETDLRTVFEAFGTIISCQLARAPTGKGHRGYGFIEYNNAQSVSDAVQSMNLFDLGGLFLRVGRAVTPPAALSYTSAAGSGSGAAAACVAMGIGSRMPTESALAAASITAKINALQGHAFLQQAGQFPPQGSPAPVPVPASAALMAPVAAPHSPSPSGTSRRGFGAQAAAIPPPRVVTPPLLKRVASGAAVHPSSRNSPAPDASLLQPVPPPSGATDDSTAGANGAGDNAKAKAKKPNPDEDEHVKAMRNAETMAKLLATGVLSDKQKELLEDSSAASGGSIAAQEHMRIKGNEARSMLMRKLMRPVDSSVVVLRNMVGPDDVDDSLQEEVQEECAKYGLVQQVVICQEERGEGLEDVVKIFVRFSLSSGCGTGPHPECALENSFFTEVFM